MTSTAAKFHKGQVVTLNATGEKVRIMDLDTSLTASLADSLKTMWVAYEENPDRNAMVSPRDVTA